MRRGASLALLVISASCASTPEPPPEPPPAPPPPKEEPPPPPPPPPRLAVAPIRAVATEAVPAEVIERMSARLSEALQSAGARNTKLDLDKGCVTESCQLEAVRETQADSLLHARIVQYLPTCIVLGTLYGVGSSRAGWGFAKTSECDEASLSSSVDELAKGLAGRDEQEKRGAAHAVVPVQHRLQDLAWASESLAELMTTLLASVGRPVVAASSVAKPVADKGGDVSRVCGNKSCALEAARAVFADRGVVVSISKKGKTCGVDVTGYDVTSGKSAKEGNASATSCAAQDIAAAMKFIVDEMAGRPEPEAPARKEKPEKPAEEKVDDASAL